VHGRSNKLSVCKQVNRQFMTEHTVCFNLILNAIIDLAILETYLSVLRGKKSCLKIEIKIEQRGI